MGEICLLAILLTSYEIGKIGIFRREGGDLYNGDADAEDPVEGSKKRKKKVTKCLTLAHSQYMSSPSSFRSLIFGKIFQNSIP